MREAEMLLERKLPLVGDGGGVWSFTHVEDAASATESRGASNEKAKRELRKRELHWQPHHPSWREAFASGAG